MKLPVLIVGGGMITHDQILPSLYQLRRQGVVGDLSISALNGAPLKALAESKALREAFPDQSFTPYPDFRKEPPDRNFPDLFKEVLRKLPPRSLVAVALPDQLHYGAVKEALLNDQHVLCVKPLVLKYAESVEIEALAFSKGLVVGVEYHKRFDDRSLIARRKYRAGLFGEFKIGQARLIEPWYYRHSNFQNWCTVKNSDPFSYVACHYVDLLAFITGLLPVEVSVYGIVEKWPNGKEAFLWSDGRVVWNNGASLNVLNGFGYPDRAPGGNSQGLMMFCNGGDEGGYLEHMDSFRGVKHALPKAGAGDKMYHETNPDYLQYVAVGGAGFRPVGYGYRSIEYIVQAVVIAAELKELKARQEYLKRLDDEGIMATPKNSAFNELVMEAGRLSILNGGRPALIQYGEKPGVRLKEEREYVKY